MKKKTVFAIFLVLALGLSLLAGCGGDGKQQGEKPTKLYVVNWKDYATDDKELVKAFEEANNCEIVNTFMSSEEDLLTRLRTGAAGEIDICLPNVSILTSAIDEGLLEEIDVAKMENFDKMFERFQTQKECMKDGKYYAVPFVWGSTSIAYNTDMLPEAPDSMEIFWDEAYKGRVTFRDDYKDALMIGAMISGQDPNHPQDLDKIKELLIQQKAINKTYWETGNEFSTLFANKQIAVGLMWSGQAATMKLEGEPIGFTIPKEGAVGWVDNWGIAASSENKELALKFIDYLISYDVQHKWASNGGPAPVNQDAAEALDPDYAASACMDEASLNKLHFMEYLSEAEKAKWSEIWTEVKAR
ncbi:MAG: ABC transporter substrate-binding protein [Anaerovoracaceae bacterium]